MAGIMEIVVCNEKKVKFVRVGKIRYKKVTWSWNMT